MSDWRFKDHFAHDPGRYARFRPDYPHGLFRYLSVQCLGHERAWDCATGNGQVAVALSQVFRRVLARDASKSQIARAFRHHSIAYRVARAEFVPLPGRSVDLEAFYLEVERVARDGAVLALWGYRLATISPEVDAVVGRFYRDTAGPFWSAERCHLDAGSRDLVFPFTETELRCDWGDRDTARTVVWPQFPRMGRIRDA